MNRDAGSNGNNRHYRLVEGNLKNSCETWPFAASTKKESAPRVVCRTHGVGCTVVFVSIYLAEHFSETWSVRNVRQRFRRRQTEVSDVPTRFRNGVTSNQRQQRAIKKKKILVCEHNRLSVPSLKQ